MSGPSKNGIDVALASGPIYEDATYKYFGEANPGTPLATAQWRVSRMRKADAYFQWANVVKGVASFDNVFTDLVAVAALTYT